MRTGAAKRQRRLLCCRRLVCRRHIRRGQSGSNRRGCGRVILAGAHGDVARYAHRLSEAEEASADILWSQICDPKRNQPWATPGPRFPRGVAGPGLVERPAEQAEVRKSGLRPKPGSYVPKFGSYVPKASFEIVRVEWGRASAPTGNSRVRAHMCVLPLRQMISTPWICRVSLLYVTRVNLTMRRRRSMIS